MAYFWLNQRSTDRSRYKDEVGEMYHYRGNTPGRNQLSEEDRFIYYRPGDYVIFGTGEIDYIEQQETNPISESKLKIDYFAHITEYQSFDPPIRLKNTNGNNLQNTISFLKDRPGLTGVPQHSIHKISEEDFKRIIEAREGKVESVE